MWFAKYGPLTIINLSRLFECLVCKITLLGIREKTKLKKERNNPLTKGILSPMQNRRIILIKCYMLYFKHLGTQEERLVQERYFKEGTNWTDIWSMMKRSFPGIQGAENVFWWPRVCKGFEKLECMVQLPGNEYGWNLWQEMRQGIKAGT